MGDSTGIEWTDATWNPTIGCSRVSEGCRHCYAEAQAARIVRMNKGKPTPYDGLVKVRLVAADANDPDSEIRSEARWTGEVRLVPERLAWPLAKRKPLRIFVNSMSDLFHEKLSNEEIAAVFGVMAAAPQHTFQVLTKRPARMREWFAWVEIEASKAGPGAEVMLCVNVADEHDALAERVVVSPPWPLPNVWLGVSVENQAAHDERAEDLLACPAAIYFFSVEPMLGPIDASQSLRRMLRTHDGRLLRNDHPEASSTGGAWRRHVDQVIAGCESGPGARPADAAWYRSLRDQCEAAGVAFFLKQATEEGTWEGDNEHECTVLAGPGSHHKPGGVIGAPYLDGAQHLVFPTTRGA